jgi:hypothetical protein
MRREYSCSKRTTRLLSLSTYGKDGEFIRSYPEQKEVSEIVPGTVGEEILKVVCQKDFPTNHSEKDYAITLGNDPLASTKSYVEWRKSKQDTAPK